MISKLSLKCLVSSLFFMVLYAFPFFGVRYGAVTLEEVLDAYLLLLSGV